jgi:hypothetical protein
MSYQWEIQRYTIGGRELNGNDMVGGMAIGNF